ncbi:MAG: methyltransferase domain-containing protein [Myxococcales bacterium]|nr:methyltransferase domain-containing protein [Myxococcales bacterium]
MTTTLHPLRLARYVPHRLLSPLADALDAARTRALATVLSDHAFVVEATGTLLAEAAALPDGPSERRTRIESAIEFQTAGMLSELRRAPLQGVVARFAAGIDAPLRSNVVELMDRTWMPAPLLSLEMKLLDRLNHNLGSYQRWTAAVQQAVAGLTAPHIVDLAAGSGGFLRGLAASGAAAGWSLTSTDLSPAYVDAGRGLAEAARLPVAFAVRDATRLADLRGAVDLFVCTQSTHHLPPGVVVRMLHAAAAVAPRGLLVIDVVRSLGNVAAVWAATNLTAPFFPLVVDGMQSVRRSYAAAEWRLLGRLAGVDVEVEALGPAHWGVRAVARA